MPKRFREARKLNKLKLIDAAKLLGVSQPTLSAWEGERKSPSIDALEKWLNYMVYPQISCLVAQKQNTLPHLLSRSLWNSSTL